MELLRDVVVAYGVILIVAVSTTLILALVYLTRIARGLARLRAALAAVAERTAPLDAQLTELTRMFALSADEVHAARTRLVADADAIDRPGEAKPLTNPAPRTVQ